MELNKPKFVPIQWSNVYIRRRCLMDRLFEVGMLPFFILCKYMFWVQATLLRFVERPEKSWDGRVHGQVCQECDRIEHFRRKAVSG